MKLESASITPAAFTSWTIRSIVYVWMSKFPSRRPATRFRSTKKSAPSGTLCVPFYAYMRMCIIRWITSIRSSGIRSSVQQLCPFCPKQRTFMQSMTN